MSDRLGRKRILFVCTANICRSPTAELVARVRFGEEANVFRSAGFLESGRTVPPDLAEVLYERRIDATGHRSYRIDDATVAAADLLLTMESGHVQRIATMDRDALTRTAPLKEAAAVLSRFGPGTVGVDRFLAELNRDRDPMTYLGERWDIDDPYGRRAKDYRRAVDEIAQLVDSVAGRFG